MNLKWIRIKNYRSCKDIFLEFGSMHALVGANNSGKSNILRALDFLFNPSITKVDKESFWNCDIKQSIWIEAIFHELAPEELTSLASYLQPDQTFHIARSCKVKSEAASDNEESFDISQHYCKPMPKYEWLQEDKIDSKNIDEWWKNQPVLTANGNSFVVFVGNQKPKVGEWKEKAKKFSDQFLTLADFVDAWADNPKGYAGVLKGTLPHFLYIPAVRDITDEAKVTKSNPFGRLLYELFSKISDEQKETLGGVLSNVQNKLNRTGGTERLESVVATEKRLNDYLNEYMDGDLEIEFQAPTLEVLLTTPHLYADDGFRNVVENKGHGMQRAIIFSILRCYSELVTGQGASRKRSTIFAIEEPELYMHPQAQRNIRRVFQKITNSKDSMDQIIFATHSALLLDVAYFDEIIRVEAIQHTNGKTKTVESKIWQLPVCKLVEDLKIRFPESNPSDESIRELYANAYHPMRSEGFFAKRIILLEGATEQYALPIYAEALGKSLDHLGVSVVDCGGKGPMDRLYRIFNELGMPCYLLFDYDKNSKDKNTIGKSRELLEMAGEATEVPSGILIKDRVSCFPEKWEIDLAKEIADLSDLTTKARNELGLKDDSGKPLIARYIARRLTSKEPPFIPPSIKSILENAIKIEWEKSCLRSSDDTQ